MRVALYARVSTFDQHNENQTLRLVEHAKRMNWDYELFEEKESTRKTLPIKEEVLRRLRSNEFDALCIVKMDRWGRSTSQIILEFKELHERGIVIISLRDNIDMSTSSGRFFVTVLAAFAELERDLIRERTLEGLARAKAQGKRLGRPKGSKDSKARKRRR